MHPVAMTAAGYAARVRSRDEKSSKIRSDEFNLHRMNGLMSSRQINEMGKCAPWAFEARFRVKTPWFRRMPGEGRDENIRVYT
jgi:hypothetical protein